MTRVDSICRRDWACVSLAAVACAALSHSCPAAQHEASEQQASGDKVVQYFVMRRPLDRPVLGKVMRVNHSALLLRTQQGRYFTLEYMSDSRAHLTAGKPAFLGPAPAQRKALVAMKGSIGGQPVEAKWECDPTGTRVMPQWSAAELQQKMQSLMKPYNVWQREHCHTAQERLRKEMQISR